MIFKLLSWQPFTELYEINALVRTDRDIKELI